MQLDQSQIRFMEFTLTERVYAELTRNGTFKTRKSSLRGENQGK
jgi:hypothetical protein